MTDLEKLKRLKDGGKCCVNFSEGSGGFVTMQEGYYELDYIFLCGRVETIGLFGRDDLEKMIEISNNWD